MSDAPQSSDDPPANRPAFRLKPRDFVPVNPPPGTPPTGPSDVRDHLRLAAAPASISPPPARENDVHRILRDNLARANSAGLNDVKPVPRRRSRRRRDYWIVLLTINLTLYLLHLLAPNVVSGLFAFGGMVFLSTGLTWIMWVVVDDY